MRRSEPSSTTRRQILRTWVVTLGSAAGVGIQFWHPVRTLASESPLPGPLRIRLSDYAALGADGGSVQLLFSTIYPPITINRQSASQYHALDSVCTHAGCTVGKFNITTGQMRCPCHGSRYDIAGRVVGGPANQDIVRFEALLDSTSGHLLVTVPAARLGTPVARFQSQNTGQTRLRLDFPVTAFSRYEVLFGSAPDHLSQTVSFSTTPDGPLSETFLRPNDDGVRSVYVESSGLRGFFAVTLILTSL